MVVLLFYSNDDRFLKFLIWFVFCNKQLRIVLTMSLSSLCRVFAGILFGCEVQVMLLTDFFFVVQNNARVNSPARLAQVCGNYVSLLLFACTKGNKNLCH